MFVTVDLQTVFHTWCRCISECFTNCYPVAIPEPGSGFEMQCQAPVVH